jgi:hypothetical protein
MSFRDRRSPAFPHVPATLDRRVNLVAKTRYSERFPVPMLHGRTIFEGGLCALTNW